MRKTSSKISVILRIFFIAISTVLLVWVNLNFFTAGTVIGNVIFITSIVICAAWKPFCGLIKRIWSRNAGKVLLVAAFGAVGFLVGACLFFSVNMLMCVEKPLLKTDAVIVLGCQVRGEQPSSMLAYRLNAAIETLEANPSAVCVVSGGKGKGEDISEAEAMRRYLKERGIAPGRIRKEDKSVSTRENIAFSAEILSEEGITDNIVIVTNDFHQYRAGIYAKRCGLKVGHHSSRTPFHNLLNYWIREWAAILAVEIGI